MKRLLVLLLFCAFGISYAQTTFTKTYGYSGLENARAVVNTSFGYAIGGVGTLTGTQNDMLLIVIEPDGDTVFAKAFGGAGFDLAYGVAQVQDGGYILGGFTESFGAGDKDFYLVKADLDGNYSWSKTFGGVGEDYMWRMKYLSTGNIVMVGTTTSFGAGGKDVYVVCTDGNGTLLWTKTIGGTADETCYGVGEASDGGILVSAGTRSYGNGSLQGYFIKLDASGNLLWATIMDGPGSDYGYAVVSNGNGGGVFSGITGSGQDAFAAEFNSAGGLVWAKTWVYNNGALGDWFSPLSIYKVPSGGYSIGGYFKPDSSAYQGMMLSKMSDTGDLIWSKGYGGEWGDSGWDCGPTNDGGYYVCGLTSSYGFGNGDIMFIKTDSMGNAECDEIPVNVLVSSFTPSISSGSTVGSGASTSNPATVETAYPAQLSNPCLVESITEAEETAAPDVYPNPSKGVFTFSNQLHQVKVYDVTGSLVAAPAGQLKQIDLAGHPKGIYFLTATEHKKPIQLKLLLE